MMLGVIRSCILIILWVSVVTPSNVGSDRQDINLYNDGGYTDLLVGISDRVTENRDIIIKLQKYLTEASSLLHTATKNRLYLRNVTILVPPHWTADPSWELPNVNETFRRSRIIVEEPNLKWGDVPYTLQPGRCREEGDYIHFTPGYLAKDPASSLTHRPAKTLVKEFARLKWGLFDESVPVIDTINPKFYPKNNTLVPVGCTEKVTGTATDLLTGASCVIDDYTGAFPLTCKFTPTSTPNKASLNSFEYLDEVVEFCDNIGKYVTHSRDAPNHHNKICDQMSSWEVMNTLPDFDTDYSVLRNGSFPPATVFRMMQDPIAAETAAMTPAQIPVTTTAAPSAGIVNCIQDIVCLCLDVSGSMSTRDRIGIMSQSAQNYILNFLRNDTAVGIVSFSTTPTVLAGMTVITSLGVRDYLTTRVPRSAGGGTGIGGGLRQCQQILRTYDQDRINQSRIVLLSDGQENGSPNVAEVLPDLIRDGILIDSIIYGQNAQFYDISESTGGKNHMASDVRGDQSLDIIFKETANRGCSVQATDAVVDSSVIMLGPGKMTYSDTLYFDITIGVNSKLVFKYNEEINVTVVTPGNNSITYNSHPSLKLFTVIIEGEVDRKIEYTIRKLGPSTSDVRVVLSVTSSPVPGVQPILYSKRINQIGISFSPDTKIVGYVGVFQGATPVLGLNVTASFEQPNGILYYTPYVDDGTGMDSTPNDGIYTGYIAAHKIDGGGGRFFNLKPEIKGQGYLPSSIVPAGSRIKRCVGCLSLGNVTRTSAGDVIIIDNWRPVPDTTPPEKITSLTVLNAAANGDNVFTLGWIAPGDDLNIGQVSGYDFAMSTDPSTSNIVPLPTGAMINDSSAFLVPAGTDLEMQVNASLIRPDDFGLPANADLNTFYLMMRTTDAAGNRANWSIPVSISHINPATVIIWALPTTTTPPTTTTTPTPTTTPTTTTTTATPTTTTASTTTRTTTTTTTTTPSTTATTVAATTTTTLTTALTSNNLSETDENMATTNFDWIVLAVCLGTACFVILVAVIIHIAVSVHCYRKRGGMQVATTLPNDCERAARPSKYKRDILSPEILSEKETEFGPKLKNAANANLYSNPAYE